MIDLNWVLNTIKESGISQENCREIIEILNKVLTKSEQNNFLKYSETFRMLWRIFGKFWKILLNDSRKVIDGKLLLKYVETFSDQCEGQSCIW